MLSKEQQNTIENSIWVVNTALKRQGLQNDEDLRQSAILYMCKCLERYDPTKGIKWTTYAYKNIFLYIKKKYSEECKVALAIVDEDIFSLEATSLPIDEDMAYNDKYVLQKMKLVCTSEECKVLELKKQGYRGAELCGLMGCSRNKISGYIKSIRAKARQILYGDNLK